VTPRPDRFRRNVLLIAALAITVRLLIAAASWRATHRLAESGRDLARAQESLAALESVRSGLDRAQAAELTFLLTGRDADLAEFDENERATRRQLAHAWALAAADDAVLQPRFSALAKLVDRRFELRDMAAAARQGHLNRAKARVVAQLGADAAAQALAAVEETRAAELSRLAQRAADQRRVVTRSLAGIALTAVLSIAAVVAVALWLLPAFDERVAERDSLRPDRALTRI
jgi:CHASE3 domain sensor protein